MSNNLSLKGARRAAGLSQPEVARYMGVSAQTVYKWERGISPVARDRWEKLARLLKLSVLDLERALVKTLLDACVLDGNAYALDKARSSRLYDTNLIADAFAQFEKRDVSVYPVHPVSADKPVSNEERKDFEIEKLTLKNRILELEKENAELRLELERNLPAASLSSALNRNEVEDGVKAAR